MAEVRKLTTCGKIERWHRSFRNEGQYLVGPDVQLLRWYHQIWMAHYNSKRPQFESDLEISVQVYFADLISGVDITIAENFYEVC